MSFSAWTIEAVDAQRSFSIYRRTLVIDSTNHPHIAYGGDNLYYAHSDGNLWQYDVIDASQLVGSFASIAVDSNDKVHISYHDISNSSLKYATNVTGSWVTETVDNSGDVGTDTCIAEDSNRFS